MANQCLLHTPGTYGHFKLLSEPSFSFPADVAQEDITRYVCEHIFTRVLARSWQFDINNASKGLKVILHQDDLKAMEPTLDAERIKKTFDILLAEKDIIIADKITKSFFLNFGKQALVEEMSKSNSYKIFKQTCTCSEKSNPYDQFTLLVLSGDMAALSKLVKEKGVNFENTHGQTILHLAVGYNNVEMVKWILTVEGVDVNHVKRRNGKEANHSPLIVAGISGNVEIIRRLIDAGANIKFKNEDGFDVFSAAVINGRIEACRYLVKEHKINPRNYIHEGVLPNAACSNSIDVVKFLLDECQIPVDVQTVDVGNTAFQKALEQKNIRMAEVLLDHGANINHKTRIGGTALMMAACTNNVESATFLLRKGCTLNDTDFNTETALHLAVKFGFGQIIVLLAKAGADPDVKNNMGYTAYDLARQHKQDACKRILEAAYGKRITSLCVYCNKDGMNFRVCGGCKNVRYCSVECQKSHWKEHKKECKTK